MSGSGTVDGAMRWGDLRSYEPAKLVSVEFTRAWANCAAVWEQLVADGVPLDAIVSMGPSWVSWVEDDE